MSLVEDAERLELARSVARELLVRYLEPVNDRNDPDAERRYRELYLILCGDRVLSGYVISCLTGIAGVAFAGVPQLG